MAMVTSTMRLASWLCLLSSLIDGFVPPPRSADRVASVAFASPVAKASRVEVISSPASSSKPDANGTKPRMYDMELSLLNQSLQSFNSAAAKSLIDTVSEMRSNGTDATEIEAMFDALLTQGPDKKRPPTAFWMSIRPLSRFSQRCRMASLRRTLDLTTPPPTSSYGGNDGSDGSEPDRRRRRALLSLLRQLAAAPEDSDHNDIAGGSRSAGVRQRLWRAPAIRIIESKARREQGATAVLSRQQLESLRARLAPGLETPRYEVLVPADRRDGVEVRRYQPYTVCSVRMGDSALGAPVAADGDDGGKPGGGGAGGAFNVLAAYLFGKNQQQKAMKMTTPVLMDEEGDAKRMSFVLPSEFWMRESLSNAPQPIEGSGVSLAVQDEEDRAVVMFGGFASKAETERRKKQLLSGLAKNRDWLPKPRATVTLAQYNDPFTLPWKRLNEVSIAVQRRK